MLTRKWIATVGSVAPLSLCGLWLVGTLTGWDGQNVFLWPFAGLYYGGTIATILFSLVTLWSSRADASARRGLVVGMLVLNIALFIFVAIMGTIATSGKRPGAAETVSLHYGSVRWWSKTCG